MTKTWGLFGCYFFPAFNGAQTKHFPNKSIFFDLLEQIEHHMGGFLQNTSNGRFDLSCAWTSPPSLMNTPDTSFPSFAGNPIHPGKFTF